MIEYSEATVFACPYCGIDVCFGSYPTGIGDDREYYCYGHYERGCRDKFKCTSNDLWKYMRLVVNYKFESPEEFKTRIRK